MKTTDDRLVDVEHNIQVVLEVLQGVSDAGVSHGEVLQAMTATIQEIRGAVTAISDSFQQINSRLDDLEGRADRLEARAEIVAELVDDHRNGEDGLTTGHHS